MKPKSLGELMEAANIGDAEAMYLLGCQFAAGEGVAQNIEKAFYWYSQSAALGFLNAIYSLAICYYMGQGVSKNFETSYALFLKAAQKGHLEAAFYVGCCLFTGQGVTKDFSAAFKWLRKASQKGLADAQYLMGTKLINGQGIQNDKEEGFYLIRLAAENGHKDAVKYLIENAVKNDEIAQYHLGFLHAIGKGVCKDDALATRILIKSTRKQLFGKPTIDLMAKYESDNFVTQGYGITSLEELATKLGISLAVLSEVSQHKDRYYKRISIAKSNNRIRKLDTPCKKLKKVQRLIISEILCTACPSKYATAYVPKKGLKANLEPHINHRYFLCLDIHNFFGSIKFEKIFKLFLDLGCTPYVAYCLSRLCSYRNYLPQGAPTSPSISNLIMKPFDLEVSKLCQKADVAFTRYADDMTFSSNDKNLENFIPQIKQLLIKMGFHLNFRKTRLMGARGRCVITGVVKNTNRAYFGIGKLKKRRMRAIMHAASKGIFSDSKYSSLTAIEGWLSFLKSIDLEGYQQMTDYWKALKNIPS